ncbi:MULTISPECIES: hypothetical protein [Methanohalophilus]|jgi:uncharacterized membrane protein (UPF0136 family)|uniref:Uncharacterized protein n=1 Tax=Methanohalophilus euhalobius TaxID=51203 RepID=A0A285F866_9EURY|nr:MULTISPECIES: hypothetical protein [Methanohalophilus]KXS46839.1 MAG: hypothetical protein AWU58_205 [Methanohalophilus sp. T328-1]RSD34999.1 MAG: hypothetical protein CI953_437 [Methanohalophilus sp.]OBZ35434.1 MAG: hypothetical protein A9957_07120 [Methanohalophilus sp. DAL1]ODV50018.1 MAG: hypothetical protein A8273_677 [Methanohalophilus sp. 2-GBenrich]PQV43115.1 hypothetical protein B0H22_103127 [Methanohalophilus euhalobius]
MEKNHNGLKYISLLWGILYMAAGLVQVAKGVGLLPASLVSSSLLPAELAGGLVLVVIGAVFFVATFEFSKDSFEGSAYAYVGILLCLVFGTLYFLSMVADLINAYILAMEGYEKWTFVDSFKPALYLGILSGVVYAVWKNRFKPVNQGGF